MLSRSVADHVDINERTVDAWKIQQVSNWKVHVENVARAEVEKYGDQRDVVQPLKIVVRVLIFSGPVMQCAARVRSS